MTPGPEARTRLSPQTPSRYALGRFRRQPRHRDHTGSGKMNINNNRREVGPLQASAVGPLQTAAAKEFWRSANPNGIRGRAGNYHRPLSIYLNGLVEANLRLDRVVEPKAICLLAEQQPVYRYVPIFFAARAIAS